MNLYVLDTDILTLYQSGHPRLMQRVRAHSMSELAITVISVEEALSGWYTRLRQARKRKDLINAYRRPATSFSFLSQFRILTFDDSSMTRYENLRASLKRFGKDDLQIAAIVIEYGAVLITRNRRDFQQVPGLSIDDWSR